MSRSAQSLAFAALAVAMGSAAGQAARPGEDDGAAEHWAFKLTPSLYSTSNERNAIDINLRANLGDHALWLGYYRRDGEFQQARTGYEYTAQTTFGKLVPSLQLATHGFVGASLNAEIGDDSVFALLGLGRTNTRDYFNLNFDPNDALLYGIGTRRLADSTWTLFRVSDNRLHTGQRITHLVWRFQSGARQRWTLDAFAKAGRATPDDEPVSAGGLSATYDFDDKFIRVARDPKVNFTRDDMTRISFGLRF
jgi:hypothetical protein